MIETSFTIEAVHCVQSDGLVADARARYKAEFPGRSARRMTHLGMMVTLCLREMQIEQTTPVIYTSAFAETESLEKFIDSFPQASPALFQCSIHPSAVEQALIPQQCALDRFYPILSDENLPGKGLENCFLLGEDSVVLVGGEECGTWLGEAGRASATSFAFALQLKRSVEGDGGLGRVTIEHARLDESVEAMDLAAFAVALERRESIRVPSFALGAWIRVDWS